MKFSAPARDREGRRAALRRVFALGFDRDLLLAPHVQFARRVRVLINLPALGARRDGIENPALGDARLDVLRDELVAVAGDADAGVLRLVMGPCGWRGFGNG